jgi:hypothetical protein
MQLDSDLGYALIDREEAKLSAHYITVGKAYYFQRRLGSSSKLGMYLRRKVIEIFRRLCKNIEHRRV